MKGARVKGGDLDVLSASFADDFAKMLNGSIEPKSANALRRRQYERRKQSSGLDAMISTENLDRLSHGEVDSKLSGNARSQSPYSKNINIDISMNMIKEVDEGQTSQRQLRKRIKAIERTRKQNQRVKKLQKAQLAVTTRNSSSHRLKAIKLQKQQQLQVLSKQSEMTDFERQESLFGGERDLDFDAKMKNRLSFSSVRNQSPTRVPRGLSRDDKVKAASYNPRQDPEVYAQMRQGVNALKRTTTHYDGDRRKSDFLQGNPVMFRIKSTENSKGLKMMSNNTTPYWGKQKSGYIDDQIAVNQFEKPNGVPQDQPSENQKPDIAVTANDGQTDGSHLENGLMFSDTEVDILTAEEVHQVNQLKNLRLQSQRQIDHTEISNGQMQFSQNNMGLDDEYVSQHRLRQVSNIRGRWIAPAQQMQSSSSAAKIECARESRLRQGFKKRIIFEKNKPSPQNGDLYSRGDTSAEDRAQLESSLIKSLGPKLQGVVLQLPPQTVFDFKDQLRRPASAKVEHDTQLHRSLINFQRQQRKRQIEARQEQAMQQRKEQQVKDLMLEQYSWDLPYAMSTAGLNQYKRDQSDNQSDFDNKSSGGGKTKGKKKKGKGKTQKEDKPLTEEEKRQLLLNEMREKRREQAISNLWPEPNLKIFIGDSQLKRGAMKKRSPIRHRNIQVDSHGMNHNALNANQHFESQLKLKLDKLNSGSMVRALSKKGTTGQPLNYDLIIETQSSSNSHRSGAMKSLKTQGFTRKQSRKSGLNADLPGMATRQSRLSLGANIGKSTFSKKSKTFSMGKLQDQSSENQMQDKAKQIMNRREELKNHATRMTDIAIDAIRRGSQTSHFGASQHKKCRTHGEFNCKCIQFKNRKSSVNFQMKRMESLNKISNSRVRTPLNPHFKRVWEKTAGTKSGMKQDDKYLYMRPPPIPLWKDIEENYDDDLVRQIQKKRLIKLYDVQDIQKELEELTEDEDEVRDFSQDMRDVWKIKRLIKMNLKRYFVPPNTTLEMFKIGRILGKGAYGKVNLAIQKLSNMLCAVKSINMKKVSSDSAIKKITNEKELLKDLRHQSIVKLYEAVRDDEYGYELLFMELCTGGDLLHYLRRRRRLEEPVAKLFMRQLMNGLGYLHSKDIAHRDIKLENILLSNLGRIKICDLGVSVCMTQKMKDGKGIQDCCGTPAYMAPEVIKVGEQRKEQAQKMQNDAKNKKKKKDQVQGYGTECDIWSAGVLLYALVYGTMPFRGITVREIKEKVLAGKFLLKDTVSEEVRDLISGMLRPREERITVEEVLAHNWFKDTPAQESIKVFNESERAVMIKEYFFSTDPDHWEKHVNVHPNELEDYLQFTNRNLKTTASDEQVDLKNVSSCSQIMAPNNSTQSEGRTLYDDLPPDVKEESKLEMIGFSRQAYRVDAQYERDHNENCDNGVYREEIDHKDLASRSGLKDEDVVNVRQYYEATTEAMIKRQVQPLPRNWEEIDENKDWTVGEVSEPNNPYAEPFVIRGDLVFKVSRFGYTKEHILESIINNKATHQATTYYLLQLDQKTIC